MSRAVLRVLMYGSSWLPLRAVHLAAMARARALSWAKLAARYG
jgi:hypothetical protein